MSFVMCLFSHKSYGNGTELLSLPAAVNGKSVSHRDSRKVGKSAEQLLTLSYASVVAQQANFKHAKTTRESVGKMSICIKGLKLNRGLRVLTS